MMGLISLLIRGAITFLPVEALIKSSAKRFVGALIIYAVIALLGLAALISFYVFLYYWLAAQMGDSRAAAAICGGNLLLIAVILIGKTLLRSKVRSRLSAGKPEFGSLQPELEAGIALGHDLGKKIRKSAPEIALAAAILGVVIGLRPQILGILKRRSPRSR
jgi:hypothetical protein